MNMKNNLVNYYLVTYSPIAVFVGLALVNVSDIVDITWVMVSALPMGMMAGMLETKRELNRWYRKKKKLELLEKWQR